jgi:hypothetical protein
MHTQISIYILQHIYTGLKISAYLTKNLVKNKSYQRILKKIQILQLISCFKRIEMKKVDVKLEIKTPEYPCYPELRATDTEDSSTDNDYCLPSVDKITVYDDKKAVFSDWKDLPQTAPSMSTEGRTRSFIYIHIYIYVYMYMYTYMYI